MSFSSSISQGFRQVVCQLNHLQCKLRLAQGKQYLRDACPKGKLETIFFFMPYRMTRGSVWVAPWRSGGKQYLHLPKFYTPCQFYAVQQQFLRGVTIAHPSTLTVTCDGWSRYHFPYTLDNSGNHSGPKQDRCGNGWNCYTPVVEKIDWGYPTTPVVQRERV